MIRLSGSLFISIALHAVLISAAVFAWKNYSPSQKVQCDTKVPLKLCDIVPSKEHVKPKKIEKPKKEVEKAVEKAAIKKEMVSEKKESIDPVAKKEIELENEQKKEPIGKIYIEDTPKEVVFIDENIKKQELDEEVSEEIEQESQEKKETELAYEYLQINTKNIAKLLQENLYYPRSARKRNITGEVIVRFTLRCNAEVFDVEVIESKSDILSRAAVKTIYNLSGKFPKPLHEITLHVPILYALR